MHHAGLAVKSRHVPNTDMKSPTVENIVVDEAREHTYVVMARRVLTDGEMYRDIRLTLLKRGGKRPARGETLVISASSNVE